MKDLTPKERRETENFLDALEIECDSRDAAGKTFYMLSAGAAREGYDAETAAKRFVLAASRAVLSNADLNTAHREGRDVAIAQRDEAIAQIEEVHAGATDLSKRLAKSEDERKRLEDRIDELSIRLTNTELDRDDFRKRAERASRERDAACAANETNTRGVSISCRSIEAWCKDAHDLASSKGFYDHEPTMQAKGTWFMNITEEVCEAWDCIKSGQTSTTLKIDGKPEGLPIELADIALRLFDVCAALGVDLEHAMRIKHEYNKTRPWKHGKLA